MTRPTTAAQSMLDIHTDRPLTDIATEHAASRTLSESTRNYFDAVARGIPFVDLTDDVVTWRESAFFEAAASAATRYAHSWNRRRALGDLQRLRTAILTGQPIVPPAPRHYNVGVPASVTVHPDGRVEVWVDLSEVADLTPETDDDGKPLTSYDATAADAEVVGNAHDVGSIVVTHTVKA